jgi:hypothetical protein
LRSPNVGNANNVRNVNPSGALNNNNATNSNGVAQDCEKRPHKVSQKAEIRALTQGIIVLTYFRGESITLMWFT